MCSFFALNLEKFTPDRNFYTGSARGARDKYEVWGCQRPPKIDHFGNCRLPSDLIGLKSFGVSVTNT